MPRRIAFMVVGTIIRRWTTSKDKLWYLEVATGTLGLMIIVYLLSKFELPVARSSYFLRQVREGWVAVPWGTLFATKTTPFIFSWTREKEKAFQHWRIRLITGEITISRTLLAACLIAEVWGHRCLSQNHYGYYGPGLDCWPWESYLEGIS